MNPQPKATNLLGPFVGDITSSSVKIWLNIGVSDGDTEAEKEPISEADKTFFITLKLHEQGPKSEAEKPDSGKVTIRKVETAVVLKSEIKCRRKDMGTGIAVFNGLEANARYFYELWEDKDCSIRLGLGELAPEDLYFWTLPEDGYGRQLDFLLMSCHNPGTAKGDGCDGFAVWRQIPDVMSQNANVRFAILAGDQIYADEVEAKVLKERNPEARRRYYLDVYREFWSNEYYRRVLCRLPSVLMWDDHDITDGWGSREDSYYPGTEEFTQEWKDLFGTAKEMFQTMQASRNPDPLSKNFEIGFDTCFRIGRAGFAVPDLRSNRKSRMVKKIVDGKTEYEGQIWLPEQLQAIRSWVEANKQDIDTLFFVSSVVFSHGAPVVENWIASGWLVVLKFFSRLERWGILKSVVKWFNTYVGDLRDDINDSWGSKINEKETDLVLDFLFETENPTDGGKRVNVVILSGDIHTPGYSTIYSSSPRDNEKRPVPEPEGTREGRAVIPHIVATPVAYQPFSWLGEAIFRHLTKVVRLGERGTYTSQVSHHFCYRNVVVVSLRNYQQDESHLKVKYYLEGYPEPQVMLFDLAHGARRENIQWPAVKRNTWLDRRGPWLKRRLPANWFPRERDIPTTPIDLPEDPPKIG